MFNLKCIFKQDNTYGYSCALTNSPTCCPECQYYVTDVSSEYIMGFCAFGDGRIPRNIYWPRREY